MGKLIAKLEHQNVGGVFGDLEIRNLKGLEFQSGNVTCKITRGFGFYVEGKGYMSFKEYNDVNGVKTPYAVSKLALDSIVEAGGLVHYADVEWLHPSN